MAEQTTRKVLEAGEQAAITPSVTGWGVFGWAFALVAIPLVYMRSPKMPISLVAAHDDGATLPLFERAYVERLKARQVEAVWIGFLCAVVTFVLASAMYCSMPGSSGVLSGRRSQIEFPTVEVDGVDEVLLIAETARRGLDPLNP